MFERPVRNGMKHTGLGIQRRMIPEIRGLVDLVYEDLQDHTSVLYSVQTLDPRNGRYSVFFLPPPATRGQELDRIEEKDRRQEWRMEELMGQASHFNGEMHHLIQNLQPLASPYRSFTFPERSTSNSRSASEPILFP